MLPSDMNPNIKTETVGYNNKVLVSDDVFSLWKNDNVNNLEPAKEAEGNKPKLSHQVVLQPSLHKNKLPLTERKKLP